MAVKEPGWILEAPGKQKMEIKGVIIIIDINDHASISGSSSVLT